MSYWLLSPEARELVAASRRHAGSTAAAAATWEAEALAREASTPQARDAQTLPRGLTIAGATAEIRVEGVLTKRPDFLSMFFGGGNTTYTGIRNALAVAANDPNVKTILLGIDSPGGEVDGLFETLDAITAIRASSGKTIRVRAERAQSAAYAIAAVAGTIEAVSRASTFGSIGIVASFRVDPDVVTITNSDSPNKRPDVTTDAGKAVVAEYLDQVNDEFVRAIAKGRDVDAKTVTESYGRGASFTAPNAQRLGMIDKISTPPRAVNSKGRAMAIKDEDNPEDRATTAAASDAAVQRGVTQERDRVLAHLTLGESCGDMKIALEAIRSGAAMTQELTARYMSAGMNRTDRSKRQAETNDAERAVSGTGASSADTDLGDQVVATLQGSNRSFIRG
jgi:ClpP class serine protease